MLKSFLKNFFRQVMKYRLFSLINLVGLSLSLTACLLIYSFVSYEFSFDKGYAEAEQLYRVAYHLSVPSQSIEIAATPAPLAPALKSTFAAVEDYARLGVSPAVLAHDDLRFEEEKLGYADNSIFRLFNFRWIEGDPQTALLNPESIVLTESLARKYFGTQSPLGEILIYENEVALQVTGLIEDLPSNTHLDFSALTTLKLKDASLSEFGGILDNWNEGSFATYVLLRPDTNVETVQALLPDFVEEHIDPHQPPELSTELYLRKITSIHLQPELDENATGNLTTVIAFGVTALCILLIAIVNFVNLSISRFATRSREIGMRKVAGASKAQLKFQLVGEAILFSIGATLLALVMAEQLSPMMVVLTGYESAMNYLGDVTLLLQALLFTLLLGLVAGLYPAYYFSSIRPREALSRDVTSGQSSVVLRSVLVLCQFSISITIIVVTITVHLQLRHVDRMELGYQPEQIVILPTPPDWNEKYESTWEIFKSQLLLNPSISGVTHSQADFLQIGGLASRFRAMDEPADYRIPTMNVGADFFSTYEVELITGRIFNDNLATEAFYPRDANNPGASLAGSYVLNELAANEFGWTAEEAIGQQLLFNASTVPGIVIGVVNDTLRSSRDLKSPVIYYSGRNGFYPIQGKISVRVSSAGIQQSLQHIDNTWSDFFPDQPVTRYFLEDRIDALYLYEGRQAYLFRYFSLLSIALASMGLLGLAAFNAERRTKEIGVRKVMGGSIMQIVMLLTNDFSRLVLISNLIAWPVAYIAMNRWLANFAYRIDLSPLIFIGSGAIALCIAWVTVGGTAARAASRKPVLALLYE